MKIALVTHEYPPVGGGAATACQQLAKAFVDSGHAATVITAGATLRSSRRLDGEVELVELPALRLRALAPTSVELIGLCASLELTLAPALRRICPDVVLAFFAVPAGYFAVRAARRLGVPVAVSLRGSDVPGFPDGRLEGRVGTVARPFVRKTLLRAGAITPNSTGLKRLALEFLPQVASKIQVISNGIEKEAVAEEPAHSTGGQLRLVQVGQLIERKRVNITLEAMAALRARAVEVELVVVGEGPLEQRLRGQAAELGIAEHVEFRGLLPRTEILQLLRGCDIYVMPSVAEGMSNALMEAVAAGLPVVVADNGTHDVVESLDCGTVIPRDDPGALAEAIERLAEDSFTRRELGERALEGARSMSWSKSAEQYVELFERLTSLR